MIYLAIDPGKATGLAVLEYPRFSSRILESPRLEQTDFIHRFAEKHRADLTVIIERWDVRKDTFGKSNQDDPRYIIGAVEWIAHHYGVPYFEQTAGQMKSFCNHPREYAKQRTLGWHKPGPGHDNDAAGHLLTHLARKPGPAGEHVRQGLV